MSLASRSPLPSTAEVQEELARAAGASTLASRARSSGGARGRREPSAARSARLELYPRGMDPRRALELCHAAIAVEREGITEEQLRAAVVARYPEAAPLPPRPELGLLVGEALNLDSICN